MFSLRKKICAAPPKLKRKNFFSQFFSQKSIFEKVVVYNYPRKKPVVVYFTGCTTDFDASLQKVLCVSKPKAKKIVFGFAVDFEKIVGLQQTAERKIQFFSQKILNRTTEIKTKKLFFAIFFAKKKF